MSLKAPLVDNRNFDDIVNQALALAKEKEYCPEWQPKNSKDSADPGKVLVYLFARLMEIVITRLNRVPEKYFLAFLDYIGAKLHPPSPARTLLQFPLAGGAKADQWAAAGSQVATEETRDAAEQIFETSDHLVVTPVKLVCAFVPDPGTGGGTNHTAVVTGIEEGEIEIFKGEDPAFYLGFDTPFSNDSQSLFFQVIENAGRSRRLQWEYYGKEGWKRLHVKEKTRCLSTPGHVRFIGPEDSTPEEYFGLQLYWLRVRLIEAAEPLSPKLQRVYLNTVWAENVETVKDELLGSADGSADQSFQLSRFPVMPGLQVWVVEREKPPQAEYEKIVEEEGEDAVQFERDDKGNIIETRVRWHAVNNFYASGPNSRHYLVEPASGKITFGGGTRGKVPPIGSNNIRCSVYQTGGGAAGNVGRGKITRLKVSLPYVNSVTNVLAAAGGTDAETLDEIKERGPFMLKHRDRAVTAEDFEWLMREAPGDIAISKCIPAENRASSGKVTLIIVPDEDKPQPQPSETLIAKVESYLHERFPASLAGRGTRCVEVQGPVYIEAAAEAVIVPLDINRAGQVEERVISALEEFIHPLRGGPAGKGWQFGRNVLVSEVMQVLQNTEGVDFVKSLLLIAETSNEDFSRVTIDPDCLPCSGKHEIKMVSE